MPIKSSTETSYISKVKTIAKRLGDETLTPETINEWLTLEKFLRSMFNLSKSSQIGYINAVVYFLDKQTGLYKDFYEYSKGIRADVENSKEKYKKTDKEARQWKSRSFLKKLYLKYRGLFNETPSRDLFIILFYLYPFYDKKFGVMRNDIATLQLNSGVNIFDIETKKIILVEHKTSRSKGTKVKDVPEGLFKLFEKWIRYNNVKNGDKIVDISKNMVTAILTKNIGCSTSMLRKINQTELHGKTYQKMAEARETADLQDHSMSVVDKHYIKIN